MATSPQSIGSAAMRSLRAAGWKSLARTVLLFTVPAFFLQIMLVKLGGGALWLPEQWRSVLLVVGVLVGQVCFGWAHERPPGSAPEHNLLDGEPVEPARDRVARRKAREREEQHARIEHQRRISAAKWLGVCVVLVLGYVLARTLCVESATIPADVSATLDIRELPYYFDVQPVVAAEDAHAAGPAEPTQEGQRKAQAPTALTGTVLVPIFLSDPGDLAALEGRREEGQNIYQHYLQEAPESLIALVSRNHVPFAATIALFAVLYFGIVGTASIAYGRMFSAPEEIGAGAVELAQKLLGGH